MQPIGETLAGEHARWLLFKIAYRVYQLFIFLKLRNTKMNILIREFQNNLINNLYSLDIKIEALSLIYIVGRGLAHVQPMD